MTDRTGETSLRRQLPQTRYRKENEGGSVCFSLCDQPLGRLFSGGGGQLETQPMTWLQGQQEEKQTFSWRALKPFPGLFSYTLNFVITVIISHYKVPSTKLKYIHKHTCISPALFQTDMLIRTSLNSNQY